MGKKKDKGAAKADGARKIPKQIAGIKLPKDMRRKGEALIARAASPAGQAAIARGLTLAAGLATAAADRSTRARAAASVKASESGEGAAGPTATTQPPADPAKVIEAVRTVADEVLGRLFGPKKA